VGIIVRPNPVNHPSANTLAGIGFVILSVACFAVLDTVAKNISASMSLMLALWFRYFIQALLSTVFFLPKRGMALFKTAHPRFQIARGMLLFVSSMCAFYGLKYLPVGEFTAIVSITPLVVTLVAAGYFFGNIPVIRNHLNTIVLIGVAAAVVPVVLAAALRLVRGFGRKSADPHP
jgi:drug/metabolite transporter (DMT)-like permease